ncbi:MAG: hypothetical protein AAF485_21010, partial [Chloroflexota bacterium]
RVECKRFRSIEDIFEDNSNAVRDRHLLKGFPSAESVEQFFRRNLRNPLWKPIALDGDGNKVTYEDSDYWYSTTQIEQVFDAMIDFTIAYTSCYVQLLRLGGSVVPALQEIVNDNTHKLHLTAYQLLPEICIKTTQTLKENAENLLCVDCFVRPSPHRIEILYGKYQLYYGCRVCAQSEKFLDTKGNVIAVLDNQMDDLYYQDEDALRVNWLNWRKPFDFECIEIIQTTDEAVERFAVQMGNDTDRVRQPRYKQMECIINQSCELTDNAIRVLNRIFGTVKFL